MTFSKYVELTENSLESRCFSLILFVRKTRENNIQATVIKVQSIIHSTALVHLLHESP